MQVSDRKLSFLYEVLLKADAVRDFFVMIFGGV